MLRAVSVSILVGGIALSPPVAEAQAPVHVPPEAMAPARYHSFPSLRELAAEEQSWVEKRVTEVIPALMREYGVEMWVISQREYAEDPVFFAITSPTTFAARRRSIYVFHDRGPDEGVERLALGGTTQGGIYTIYRSERPAPTGGDAELWGDEQWRLFRELVEDRDPANIVLNIDEHHAFADGLHAGEREALERALGPWVDRVRREPRLAIDFIAHRIPEMMPRYRQMMETVHAMISEAFSNAVIEPGVTTTDDVVWWMRERIREMGMQSWFQPSVSVQRAGALPPGAPVVPERGDVVLRPSTWHSIELQATVRVPEWGDRPVRCRQEEEAYLDEAGERHWVFRRQEQFHIIW